MSRDPLAKYLAGRAITAPWRIEGCPEGTNAGCVVIPALGESLRIFKTLHSLAANPPELLAQFLIVIVVNHREDATEPEKRDNRETLARLRLGYGALRLGIIDAAGPGLELPAKTGGVGLARRIGMDLALPLLAPGAIMVCLDADTLVEANYLRALRDHFAGSVAGGAVIPFCHQAGETSGEERAITLYELYLRHYVLGLEQAGSPYAFHCVGSAMACTAAAYLKMGGMNARSAGEDFYFLQQLQRTSGIARVSGTVVHPAARSSHRVPFGTGKSIARILELGEESQSFYHPDCFRILGKWLGLVEAGSALSGSELLAQSAQIDPQLASYLETARFAPVWDRLGQNAGGPQALKTAFHGWFDALKTVRLVHHLSLSYPRCGAAAALPDLLRSCGAAGLQGDLAQLELLRGMQNRPHSN
jgi:glycosyltransferase involved in cell wall biosynthesis